MSTGKKSGAHPAHFETVSQGDLPTGRRGKHYTFLLEVIEDLQGLPAGRAIRIPLAEFSGTLADMRSAVSRAAKKRKIEVATSSDDNSLYIWKTDMAK